MPSRDRAFAWYLGKMANCIYPFRIPMDTDAPLAVSHTDYDTHLDLLSSVSFLTVSNKCHHLWGRLKNAELPNNAREWKIEDGLDNLIAQRKDLWQSYEHNVGPNLPGTEDLDFLAQLRLKAGQDLGFLSPKIRPNRRG